jgi:hypothetical protein
MAWPVLGMTLGFFRVSIKPLNAAALGGIKRLSLYQNTLAKKTTQTPVTWAQ